MMIPQQQTRLHKNKEQWYRDLVSGRQKGFIANLLRKILSVFALLYQAVTSVRNWLYDHNWLKSRSVGCPSVSVGNITMGGTGKTPFVAWIARFYLTRKVRPGLISRGYKAEKQQKSDILYHNSAENSSPETFQQQNDEAMELGRLLPTVPHFLGHSRYHVAAALRKKHPDVSLLILDDAFQHRAFSRTLDLVLIDALNPFGFNRTFPAGLLRESSTGLKRAKMILLSHANLVSPERRNEIRHEVEKLAPDTLWGEICHQPVRLVQWHGSPAYDRNTSPLYETSLSLPQWREQQKPEDSFLAFCGLGNPDGFYQTLKEESLPVTSCYSFPDHHHYSASDLERLFRMAEQSKATVFLTTMKDLVKIRRPNIGNRPLYACEIGIQFLKGQNELECLLENLIPRKVS
ncbi:MAG: tetraacyldisaccharide 4'-kinase [Thermoguttaceae bacterium]|nr:tetraacyldisaccharide 4'-kinase [Thermoguttaceae bacterium]